MVLRLRSLTVRPLPSDREEEGDLEVIRRGKPQRMVAWVSLRAAINETSPLGAGQALLGQRMRRPDVARKLTGLGATAGDANCGPLALAG